MWLHPQTKDNMMAIFTVGPNSTYPTIAAAMAAAGPGDTIQLEAGYSSETAVVTHSGMIITGEASSVGIVLQLGSAIATVTLAGAAPINLLDASDGNGIVGNDGNNLVTVTAGADAASGGLGNDRLFVDYRLATGAVTGDSTSNVAEAGGGGRLVTINGGFEHFTIWTGSGADTITTGDGDDDIRTGEGAGTVTAGEGANHIVGGSGADTITAGSGGNFVDGGHGTNTITTGGGMDVILSGNGADTIVAGAGVDSITVTGGSDTVDGDAGSDLLIVNYSAAVTDVTGGVTGGNLGTGYTGHFADLALATLDFVEIERFNVTTGTGNDAITTGGADDVITTGAGSDYLDGGAGADQMSGQAGNDVYGVDNANDQVIEAAGEGSDVVYSLVDYSLSPGSSVERLSSIDWTFTTPLSLTGNELANLVEGNAGANLLNGGGGADRMLGFGGNDIYVVDNGGDQVIETAGQGSDVVYALADYTLIAGSNVERLSSIDWSSTNALNLTGNELANLVEGNAGANVLDGKGGNDTLIGFGGADQFNFTSALDASNVDTISDFVHGTDKIGLDDAVFTAIGGLGALGAGAFVNGSTALDADDRILYNQGTGQLFYDADGNGAGAAVQFATLSPSLSLTASDFMVI
jgi:Ca2+-binding RTX toxin-like protein